MPASLSTLNAQTGMQLGYQTGYFSAPKGEAISQHFFDAAFAGRINENKIYKAAYHCNIVDECGISEWLEQYMGYETDCFPEYSLIETYGENRFVKTEGATVVPQYPGTVALHIDVASQYVGSQFVLPQVGNSLVAAPNGDLIKVTILNQASSADAIITVQQRDTTGNTGAFTIPDGSELLVLTGSELSDCQCPVGQFRFPDMPIITDLRMQEFADLGEICGDALNKCQWLKIPFHDECGNVYEAWYTKALQDMYKDHGKRKRFERLLNPFFGLIPQLKARGIKWTPASSSEITTDDVREWKKELDKAGIMCREFAIFAGRNKFSQWQRMLLSAGVSQLQYIDRPLHDCGWINMDYCGLKVEGLTLHIYDECSFSNGKELGGVNMVFPDSAIIVPMCNRPNCGNRSTGRQDRGGSDNKMLTTVYFRSNDGRVFDNLTDSNGVLGQRNTFRAGCEQHEWSIKSRFVQEIHCVNWWGYMGLTA